MNEPFDMTSMIADYMEKGFLENIIDMFKHDRTLYPLIGELMTDERMRVRLGITALVETLANEDRHNIPGSIDSIARLLKEQDSTARGDAAYLLGIIGHPAALPHLEYVLADDNAQVREIAVEAIEEIRKMIHSDRNSA